MTRVTFSLFTHSAPKTLTAFSTILVKSTLVKNKFPLSRHTHLRVSLFCSPSKRFLPRKSFKSIYESVRNVFRGSLAFFPLLPIPSAHTFMAAVEHSWLPRHCCRVRPPPHLTCDGNVLLTCRGGVVIPPTPHNGLILGSRPQ